MLAAAQAQQGNSYSGLILLVFIAIIIAFGYTRLRGKMKLSVQGKHWVGPIVFIVVVVFMLVVDHAGHRRHFDFNLVFRPYQLGAHR